MRWICTQRRQDGLLRRLLHLTADLARWYSVWAMEGEDEETEVPEVVVVEPLDVSIP
jgi:hypothetical protein